MIVSDEAANRADNADGQGIMKFLLGLQKEQLIEQQMGQLMEWLMVMDWLAYWHKCGGL